MNLELSGRDDIDSTLDFSSNPRALICFSDGEVMKKLMLECVPWEWINLWPQNACLKWYRVAVKQDMAEPAATRN